MASVNTTNGGTVEVLSLNNLGFERDTLYVLIPITFLYVTIFVTGVMGNVMTCVVIAKNNSMHTATNCYLFSLAISDLMLLTCGMPLGLNIIWFGSLCCYGQFVCFVQNSTREVSTYVSILTITVFTVERYVAICHPFLAQKISKPSRAAKIIVAIWVIVLSMKILVDTQLPHEKSTDMKHSPAYFRICSIMFFVVPIAIVTVLNVLISVTLSRWTRSISSIRNHGDNAGREDTVERNVTRMLVAVVVAFFICWTPFHVERLYGITFRPLQYATCCFYYLSTVINPLLYSIMSSKFRVAFKAIIPSCFVKDKHCVPEYHPDKRRTLTTSIYKR